MSDEVSLEDLIPDDAAEVISFALDQVGLGDEAVELAGKLTELQQRTEERAAQVRQAVNTIANLTSAWSPSRVELALEKTAERMRKRGHPWPKTLIFTSGPSYVGATMLSAIVAFPYVSAGDGALTARRLSDAIAELDAAGQSQKADQLMVGVAYILDNYPPGQGSTFSMGAPLSASRAEVVGTRARTNFRGLTSAQTVDRERIELLRRMGLVTDRDPEPEPELPAPVVPEEPESQGSTRLARGLKWAAGGAAALGVAVAARALR